MAAKLWDLRKTLNKMAANISGFTVHMVMTDSYTCTCMYKTHVHILPNHIQCDKYCFNLLQEAVVDLVSNVREGLRQRMDEVDWLDDITRRRAIEKVKVFKLSLQIWWGW